MDRNGNGGWQRERILGQYWNPRCLMKSAAPWYIRGSSQIKPSGAPAAGTENSAPPSLAFVRGSAFRTPGGNTLSSPWKRTWGVGSLPACRVGSPTLFSAGESAVPCYSWQGERLGCPFTVFAGLGWGELFRVFWLEVFCLAVPPLPSCLGCRESRLCWGSVSIPSVISGCQASLTLSLGYTR